MLNTEYVTSQLYIVVLSDISHPIEGTFYLFLLAVIVRLGWPSFWNDFLKKISAPVEKNINEDGKSNKTSERLLRDKSGSNASGNR